MTAARPSARPGIPLLAAVALGGAVGALGRWALGEALPDGAGFPWTTFTINLLGSLALALLPAVAAVRERPLLAVGLGPGLLGGFTTLSAWSEQSRALLADGQGAVAAAYLGGTLAACVAGAALGSRLVSRPHRVEFAAEGGDE